jgi:hypothetical protein
MVAETNVLATQITLGMLGSGVLQYLKRLKSLPVINQNSATLNHLVLLATAAAGAIGVHYQWNPGSHSLTITGLDVASIAAGFWVWAKQWCVQYLVHKGAFGSVADPAAAPAPAPAKP